MNRQEQFGAFIAAAQEKGETNTAAETMSDLIARILSKKKADPSAASFVKGQRSSLLPYAGKPKGCSRRQSP